MAYVFGIEGVPVFEMLFIMVGLLVVGLVLVSIGLVFILAELRKLTKLIKEEQLDIIRFEKDLGVFEGKKPTDKFIDYIKTSLDKGMSRPQIEYSLYNRGFSKQKVDSIFKKVDEDMMKI